MRENRRRAMGLRMAVVLYVVLPVRVGWAAGRWGHSCDDGSLGRPRGQVSVPVCG
jgi:hypothetical protein